MTDLTGREGVAPTDYIEAALHALHANRPDVAMRYLEEGLGSRRVGEMQRRSISIRIGGRMHHVDGSVSEWNHETGRMEKVATDGR